MTTTGWPDAHIVSRVASRVSSCTTTHACYGAPAWACLAASSGCRRVCYALCVTARRRVCLHARAATACNTHTRLALEVWRKIRMYTPTMVRAARVFCVHASGVPCVKPGACLRLLYRRVSHTRRGLHDDMGGGGLRAVFVVRERAALLLPVVLSDGHASTHVIMLCWGAFCLPRRQPTLFAQARSSCNAAAPA